VPFLEISEIKMYANVTGEQERAAPLRHEEIFSALSDETGMLLTGRRTGSGVLLRAQVTLVFKPFRPHPALVVLAVWRRIGRDAVLPCRIGRRRCAVLAAAWPGIAFRMAR
jgi:hypothetical protein